MSKKILITMLIVSAIVLSIWFGWYNLKFYGRRLVFCDVGQGNGVILSKGDFQLVYDVGSDNGKFLNCVSNNLPFWDKKIEVVVVSHWDSDHSGGLRDLKNHYRLESLYSSKVSTDYGEIIVLNKGDKLENNWMSFEVIWASSEYEDNFGSVVGLLEVGGKKILLMGDVPIEIEQRLLWSQIKRDPGLAERLKNVDIVLVGHHGSKNSTSEEWINYIRPEIGVISVGENSFGHPAQRVLDVFSKYNVRVVRIDKDKHFLVKL